ncbi:MAG: DUF541 domain-containing protein [Ruminococcaceae bacterium]|nr:DUF541 domain-containing protein [Oscillospiraceae bacterium]
MERTLTVRGEARLSLPPDQAVVTMTLESRHTEYDAAMARADGDIESLRGALAAAGFDRDDLKTTDFRVSPEYDYTHDEQGNSRRVFRGWTCGHTLSLTLDWSAARLSAVLGAVASAQADPELNVAFTVRDRASVSDALLRDAAADARRRAEALAGASGVTLGALVRVVCRRSDESFRSPANLAGGMVRLAKAAPELTPADVEVSDSAVFVWEIL